MLSLKSPAQIAKMRRSGALLAEVLRQIRAMIAPGAKTIELNRVAEDIIRGAGGTPSFKGYRGFPYTLCISPDDQVVHGFPGNTPLREGQILSVDAGVVLDGWQSDGAFTAPVGAVSPEAARLIKVTEQCFYKGLEQARVGGRIGDISAAVEGHARAFGYTPIRDLCGHGIGTQLHEDPEVPNFGPAGRGVRLRAGMVICIEPMIAAGDWPVIIGEDGWTVTTRDHSLCAHYEHTIAVTEDGPRLLTLPDEEE